MDKKVLAKFECRAERIKSGNDESTPMFSFYNEKGKYIGNIDWFKRLVVERGIVPKTYDDSKVCSVGKSLIDGKWYGWSHRAIHEFTVGDKVANGDCCASSGWTEEYLKDHPDPYILPVGFEAKSEVDCKKMAIAFAASVG